MTGKIHGFGDIEVFVNASGTISIKQESDTGPADYVTFPASVASQLMHLIEQAVCSAEGPEV